METILGSDHAVTDEGGERQNTIDRNNFLILGSDHAVTEERGERQNGRGGTADVQRRPLFDSLLRQHSLHGEVGGGGRPTHQKVLQG